MSQGYDFGQLYGMADNSTVTPLEPGLYDAIVEEAEFGRTKDGTKGVWTIKFRTTTGERAGYPLTMSLSINPVKSDGSPNPQGLGIMFRQLGAMGVPVPPDQPFWALGWTEHNVAQAIVKRPVQIRVISDGDYDGTTRSKVRDIRAPRPGAPLEVQKNEVPQQAAMPPGYSQPNGGFAQGSMGGYGQPPQPQNQAPQGWQQPQAAPRAWNAQPPQPQPQGQDPYQQPGPTQPAYGGQPQNPAPGNGYVPPAPAGGQNGPYGQPNADWNPMAQQGQVPPGGSAPGGGAWQGGQPPASPSEGWQQNGQGAPPAQFTPPQQQQPQQQPAQQPQGAPELPPWAK